MGPWEPFGNVPANGTAVWKATPDVRGSFNILSTCVLTLLLCAYTSLHLDIPQYGKTGWSHRAWKKVQWVCIGLCAPEFVAFAALNQMLYARALGYQMHDLTEALTRNSKVMQSTATWLEVLFARSRWRSSYAQQDLEAASPEASPSEHDIPLSITRFDQQNSVIHGNSSPLTRTHAWTRIHNHFAIMGGFVFEAEKPGSLIRGQDCARLTLTSAALRKLARAKSPLLPDISVETIPDKSKANAFAKFLVCVQATWFVAETIGRMATAHPISLLEINTVLHAFCCLLIYLSWWDKPLDIEMPHIIYCSSNHAIGVCAWMKVKDTMDGFLEAFKADVEGYSRANGNHNLRLAFERDISVTNYVIGWHDLDDRSEIRDCIGRCRATNKQA
ncbi:hypothetical protein HBI25_222510 [Parastagonospora nodorum]|nr:hypothetical protein HBI62_222410 [Parastagonospora nodorum]KAH5443561.1 hypothetical protein HBI30_224920 [Parastagonospora nodorum]KAH5545345.1 hypothetical protein HBI25_222510 [Parastagonospora nodorum]KAH5733626.1 hypothetical protein HBI17_207390 [Parastagonospora nodorum]KAH6001030.1 hypothetical protein HBI83_215630 [Parastagonospora nodorum]